MYLASGGICVADLLAVHVIAFHGVVGAAREERHAGAGPVRSPPFP